jgi:hypothetical protein
MAHIPIPQLVRGFPVPEEAAILPSMPRPVASYFVLLSVDGRDETRRDETRRPLPKWRAACPWHPSDTPASSSSSVFPPPGGVTQMSSVAGKEYPWRTDWRTHTQSRIRSETCACMYAQTSPSTGTHLLTEICKHCDTQTHIHTGIYTTLTQLRLCRTRENDTVHISESFRN